MSAHETVFAARKPTEPLEERGGLSTEVKLAGVAGAGLVLQVADFAVVDDHMGRVILISGEEFKIDVFVSPKFGGVTTEKFEQLDQNTNEAAGEDMIVQLFRLEGLVAIWGVIRVSGGVESLYSHMMGMDMVWVVVAADGIKGEDYLRFDLSDVIDNLPGDFFKGSIDKCLGVLVVFGTLHAGITVIQEVDLLEAKIIGRTAKFVFATFGDGLISFEEFGVNFTGFTTGGANEVHLNALLGVKSESAAHAEGFIVGVG